MMIRSLEASVLEDKEKKRSPDRLPPSSIDLNRQIAVAVQGMTESEKRNFLSILNNSMTREKRCRCRKNQCIITELEQKNRTVSAVIENLSPNGAFLKMRSPLPLGSEISMSFRVLNFEFPVRLKAEVVWTVRHGMGVKFKPSLSLSSRLAEQKIADAMRLTHPES